LHRADLTKGEGKERALTGFVAGGCAGRGPHGSDSKGISPAGACRSGVGDLLGSMGLLRFRFLMIREEMVEEDETK
jgi:hypothetical protein